MSQKTRFVATAAVAVILTVVVMLSASRPAEAQPAIASCRALQTSTAAEAWMKDQIGSGRTRFVSIEGGLCSW